MNSYRFPFKGYEYERTPEFIKERFRNSPARDAFMVIGAYSAREALEKFHTYVDEGRKLGAYK